MSRKTPIPASDIREFLEEKYDHYNRRSFIERDPVSIPHLFTKKEDIEISGLLSATISWGNRKSIIANARRLMAFMDDNPFEFVKDHSPRDLVTFRKFVHRTFNGRDCVFFIRSLRNIYTHHGGLESAFRTPAGNETVFENIMAFRKIFLSVPHESRSEKHISNPARKSSAKRLCMFLRWMVRKDKRSVDFGLWNEILPSQLCLPLDVHTGNVSRKLGLLKRKQNDWTAVEEVTATLRRMDPSDPVKYDFALFGLGEEKVI
jgi:TIGR02757 family protein